MALKALWLLVLIHTLHAVLDELFAEDLLTAEECSALARQWREDRDRNLSEISPPPELSGGSLSPTLGKRGLYTKDHGVCQALHFNNLAHAPTA